MLRATGPWPIVYSVDLAVKGTPDKGNSKDRD